jgi:hypothetical protein
LVERIRSGEGNFEGNPASQQPNYHRFLYNKLIRSTQYKEAFFMELYYFSGTGNSLHVARELAARFPGASLVPIMSVLEDKGPKT